MGGAPPRVAIIGWAESDMAISVTTSTTGRVAVVAPLGDHDIATAPALRRVLYELSADVPLIVLDFTETTFLDSTVMGVLVSGCKRSAAHGHRIIGINANGIVLKALEITGIGDLLQLAEAAADLDSEIEQMLVRQDP
jgi:anti-sigma B factor antagonist